MGRISRAIISQTFLVNLLALSQSGDKISTQPTNEVMVGCFEEATDEEGEDSEA